MVCVSPFHVYFIFQVFIPHQEDAECPLCLEEMDLSDMGFKPCPCGYQVWHGFIQDSNVSAIFCRSVVSAGITSKKILTADALLVEENILKKLSSSRLLIRMSKPALFALAMCSLIYMV